MTATELNRKYSRDDNIPKDIKEYFSEKADEEYKKCCIGLELMYQAMLKYKYLPEYQQATIVDEIFIGMPDDVRDKLCYYEDIVKDWPENWIQKIHQKAYRDAVDTLDERIKTLCDETKDIKDMFIGAKYLGTDSYISFMQAWCYYNASSEYMKKMFASAGGGGFDNVFRK